KKRFGRRRRFGRDTGRRRRGGAGLLLRWNCLNRPAEFAPAHAASEGVVDLKDLFAAGAGEIDHSREFRFRGSGFRDSINNRTQQGEKFSEQANSLRSRWLLAALPPHVRRSIRNS